MIDPVLSLLKRVHALYTDDHFVYTSGKHGSVYVNKDALFQHPEETVLICRMIAERHQDYDIDAVVGPAIGGIVLAQWTAYQLTQLKGKEVLGLYTEKDTHNNQVFTRGYDQLVKNKKVLVVEDTTTTGGSVQKVINSVQKAGGKVVAACVMVNRNPENVNSETMGVNFSALCDLVADAYSERKCPLCKNKVPVNVSIGHGRKFKESHK